MHSFTLPYRVWFCCIERACECVNFSGARRMQPINLCTVHTFQLSNSCFHGFYTATHRCAGPMCFLFFFLFFLLCFFLLLLFPHYLEREPCKFVCYNIFLWIWCVTCRPPAVATWFLVEFFGPFVCFIFFFHCASLRCFALYGILILSHKWLKCFFAIIFNNLNASFETKLFNVLLF